MSRVRHPPRELIRGRLQATAVVLETVTAESRLLGKLSNLTRQEMRCGFSRGQNSSMTGRLWSVAGAPPETARWVTVWLAMRYFFR